MTFTNERKLRKKERRIKMINKTILMRRICEVPELKTTVAGESVTSFHLAVEGKKETSFLILYVGGIQPSLYVGISQKVR